ncbi:MAG: hypothetical protein ACMUEM_01645 [Flavobacteriales bacterium AspAUS03]
MADIYPKFYTETGNGEFFYLTHKPCFDALKKKKRFNLVLQNNEVIQDNGSLSVYTGKKTVSSTTIEAQHGYLNEQIDILIVLVHILPHQIP